MLQILLYYLKQYPRVPLEQTTVWYLCWFRLHSSWSRKAFPYKPCLGTDTRQNGAMHSACHRGLFNRQEAVYCLIAGICGQSQLIQEAQILSKKLFEIWSNIMDNLVSFISPPNQICISFEIHTVTQGSSWHDAIIAWWNILGCIREIWLGRYSGPLSSEVVWVWRELCFYWLFFLLRHNFLERLGTTCSSHDPSERDIFQRWVILCQIRSGPTFNMEEEVCLNITIDSLGNVKRGGRDVKVVNSNYRLENSEGPSFRFLLFCLFWCCTEKYKAVLCQ